MLTTESIVLLVLLLGLLLTLAIQIRSTLQIEKHNLVLYRLRATHDEVFLTLVDNVDNESLSREEKLEMRVTIEKLEIMTRFFNKAKERFTFKNLSQLLFAKNNSPYVETDIQQLSPEIIKVRKTVTGALLFAFERYIPFYFFRLVMKLFTLASQLLFLFGVKQISSKYEKLKEYKKVFEIYKNVNKKYHQYELCEI
ncbi:MULTISPECIES: hypothetical protein [unclassified Spirosoma]|uniref:hypothetical protein n=1 Tax=unclassified Spirosoma TaxID=2621999 RepID=UPI00095EF130|nr:MULTISPECIES: hypothetical protein [unclassified Spirosoma]MBN8821324.1 hypothetical protein [Spirosoma sp.]OJW78113.1 MAG: hypothetical protein BGO59_29275 [Spirosoma sp. 48-14]